MIKLENVTKYFDNFRVLNSLNMNIKKGTIYGLIGPNGAGKTTVINHINGCLKQDSGKIQINEEIIFANMINIK